MVTIPSPSGHSYIFFYFNLDEAVTKGLEFELRKSLGFIAPGSTILSNIFVTVNATFMEGDVTYNAEQLLFQSGLTGDAAVSDTIVDEHRNRTLQGLAPYVVNAAISYQGKKLGCNISYNRSGDILMVGGTSIEIDEYQLGRDIIDLQISYKLLKERLKIKFNVSDILAQPYVRFRNTNPDDKSLDYTDDPKGIKYNPDWDWILRKSWKGTGYSVSVSYKF
jgi:outer membrane receptor protein involved in Fe transport